MRIGRGIQWSALSVFVGTALVLDLVTIPLGRDSVFGAVWSFALLLGFTAWLGITFPRRPFSHGFLFALGFYTISTFIRMPFGGMTLPVIERNTTAASPEPVGPGAMVFILIVGLLLVAFFQGVMTWVAARLLAPRSR